MNNKILCMAMVTLTALTSTVAFAGDVGPRPIKLCSAPPADISEVYIEDRLDEVTTSKEALE